MELIQHISSETNLQKAWIKAQNFAANNAPFFDVTEYDEYSRYIKENFLIVRNELLSGTYRPSLFRQIVVNKSNGEKRSLFFTTPKDNLVMMAILNVLGPIYESSMYDGSYGYRLAYGQDESKSIFTRWQEAYRTYIIRARAFLSFPSSAYYYITDLRNFYPSINKKLLLEKLSRQIDERTYQLIENILYTECINAFEEQEIVTGLPTGTSIAPFLANIYLTDLDHSLARVSIDYVRYVDDVMFACKDEDIMNDAIGILAGSLQELGLEQNVQKTTDEPVCIQEPGELLDHTRKMHYDQRFETVKEITFEEQKEANQIFKEVFLAVESEGDIRKIAGSSATLVVRFLERNELENLEKITLKLLEIGIVKPETLRIVLATQMRIAQRTGVNFRFRDFLSDGRDIEKLTFLKLLPQFSVLAEDNLVSEILETWSKSTNYLIRSSTYDATYQLGISHYFSNLAENFEEETSEYVKSKIIRCLGRNLFDDKELLYLALHTKTNDLTPLAVFWVIYDLWAIDAPSQDEYISTLLRISNQTTTELAAWSLRLLLERNKSEWQQVYKYVPSEIQAILLECILSQVETDQMPNLIVSSIELSSDTEVVSSVGQLSSTDSVSDYIERRSQPHTGLPELGYDCSRKDYGYLSDRPDYVCQIIECPDGRRATIEYIHINRILSVKEFPTIDDWWKYLERLQDKGVVSILDRGEYSETVVYCMYEIPSELQTLHDVITNQNQNQDKLDPYRVISSIVQSMKITEEEGFRFDGIVPQNIILPSSNTPCKLLNIGFGLRPPNHNCAQPNCRHYQRRWELGRTTGLHFVGLAVLELLLNTCPMEELRKIGSESEAETTLATLLGKLDISPHMRSILGRLLQDEVTWRYQTIEVLHEDLQHITEYRNSLLHLEDVYHDQFTLVDYILFRFAIALRAPQVADSQSSPLEQTRYIITSISKHIKYLDEKYTIILRKAVAQTTYIRMRRFGVPLRRMTPEARYLLRIASAWIELIDRVRTLISIPIFPLDRLLAFYAIYSELSASVNAVAFKNRKLNSLEDIAWAGDLEPDISQVTFQLGEQDGYIRTGYSTSHFKEALQITRYVEDGSQSLLRPVTTANSLTAFLILNAMGCKSTILYAQGHLQIKTKQEANTEAFTSIANKVSKIEKEVAICLSAHGSGVALMNDSEWEDISEFLKALPQIMPIKRTSGMLLDYDALQEQGVVRRKRLQSDRLIFQSPHVFTSGQMTKPGKKRRNVSIDLVKMSNKHHLVSVHSRPFLFNDVLPLNSSRGYQFLQLVRSYPNITRICIYGTVITIILLAEVHPIFMPLALIWEPTTIIIDSNLLPEKSKDI